jgi:soluble lytic murein transglycosylase-like protein
MIRSISCISVCGLAVLACASPASAGSGSYDALVARHAAANGVPASLVHRVIIRESRYNPRAVSRGNYGIMQIRLGTARAMGYTGSVAGLLDADTNMTYAVKYLAGAYRAAGGNESRAVAYYAGGYYHQAKRQLAYARDDARPDRRSHTTARMAGAGLAGVGLAAAGSVANIFNAHP